MRLFKKRNTEEVTAPVLDEYYQEQRTRRSALSWVLGLLGLLIVILLAIGLYFGGRWGYRRLHHAAAKKPAVTKPAQTKTNNQQTAPSSGSGSGVSEGQVNAPGASNTDPSATGSRSNPSATSPNPSQSTPNNSGASANPVPGTTGTSPVPPKSRTLTNTGPGNVIATFVLITVLSGGLYEIRLRQKIS